MKYKKIHFVFDKKNGPISKKLKLFKKFKKYSPYNSDLIVVLGGDGFMLETLRKYRRFNKPFYGMNTGSYGFLMNKLKTKNFIENISKSKITTISALQMIAKTKSNTTKSEIAINEVSMLRQSKQTASLQIKKGKQIIDRIKQTMK